MRTIAIAKTDTKLAWLERFSPSSSAPEIISVGEFPFTLGRGDSCDCKLPSSRVSREHAEIQRAAGSFLIRDLGSTNGTLVNGQRADKTRLEDGDLILIADVELTFRIACEGEPLRMATQVMPDDGLAEERQENVWHEMIHSVRAWQERLLCRGTRCQFQNLVDLASGKTVGYESMPSLAPEDLEPRTCDRMLTSTDCRLTERMHQLSRLLAAENAAQFPQGELLFLRLEPAEVGADSVPASLAQLKMCGGKRIVAAISESAVVDVPYFHDFLARMRSKDLDVAYFGFAGNQQPLISSQDLAPRFLMLAPLLARGVDKSTQRQQQIRTIVEAASQQGTRVVAMGVHNEPEAQTCRELGCQLAQGEHYGYSQLGDCTADVS